MNLYGDEHWQGGEGLHLLARIMNALGLLVPALDSMTDGDFPLKQAYLHRHPRQGYMDSIPLDLWSICTKVLRADTQVTWASVCYKVPAQKSRGPEQSKAFPRQTVAADPEEHQEGWRRSHWSLQILEKFLAVVSDKGCHVRTIFMVLSFSESLLIWKLTLSGTCIDCSHVTFRHSYISEKKLEKCIISC